MSTNAYPYTSTGKQFLGRPPTEPQVARMYEQRQNTPPVAGNDGQYLRSRGAWDLLTTVDPRPDASLHYCASREAQPKS